MDLDLLQNDINGSNVYGDNTKSSSTLYHTFQMLEELGHGAYGTVTKAKSKKVRGAVYAIKHIDKKKAGAKGLREVFGEVETMSLLSHPNIVHLEEVYQDENNLWIVMEYVSGGELQRALKRQGRFPEKHAQRIAMNLLFAVDYIHQKGIVHRDLKPANCLLCEEGELQLKIADFGFSVMVGSDQCLTSFCGTTAFMAPEIIMDLNYGKPVDMWAIGVIVYLLLSGEYPFVSRPGMELTDAICQCQYSMEGPIWQSISQSAKELVSRLLVTDPHKRLTARESLKHPWIRAAMTNEIQPSMSEKTDGSGGQEHKRTPRMLFRAGVLAVMAAHRLLFIMKCVALKREGSDLALLKNFSFLVSKRYDPMSHQLMAPHLCYGNPKAVLHLISMVEASHSIETFDVSHNNIDSLDVTQQIVRVATNHQSLTALNLDNNPIPPLAGRALLRLARSGGKIRSINVHNTLIGADMIQQISTSLKEAEKKRADQMPTLGAAASIGGSGSHHGSHSAGHSHSAGITGRAFGTRPSVSAGIGAGSSRSYGGLGGSSGLGSGGTSRYANRGATSHTTNRSSLPPLPGAATRSRRL